MFLAKHPSVYQDRLGTKHSDNWKQRRFLCRNTSTPSEGTQSPVLLGWKCSLYANTVFESHLCINAISLPRQARDKHKENSQNTGFSQVIRDEGLQENAAEVGEYVLDLLQDMKSVHGSIGDVRGAGKTAFLLAMPVYKTKPNVCQDRLGTNIGNVGLRRGHTVWSAGKGLLFGVEFVEDRATRKPDALTAAYVMQRMKSQGKQATPQHRGHTRS